MAQLDQTQLAQIVGAVLAALRTEGTAPRAAPAASPTDKLAQRDAAIRAGFKRKGIPADQIKLMDRNDPKAEYNIRPFKAWLELGWQVRRGEKSIKGLFHQSQCRPDCPEGSAEGQG